MPAMPSRAGTILTLCLIFFAGAAGALPDLSERFDGDSDAFASRWSMSAGLGPAARDLRATRMFEAGSLPFLRIRLEAGDSLDPSDGAVACDRHGSRAAQLEAAGEPVGTERVEIQLRANRTTGAGEVVRFGKPVWYRFSFRIPPGELSDSPSAGTEACRTVIHQVKQDASRNGEPCGASPFFKVEARPLGNGVQIFAQVTEGEACAVPPRVRRVRLCLAARPTDTWIQMHVRMVPEQDDTGVLDMWLDGAHCGAYRGPMGDALDGVRRAGAPFVNVQPRFGLYRDRRMEGQGIDLRDIAIWTRDPEGDPEWGAR